MFWPDRKFPSPQKFFPVFLDFLRSFKLHKGIFLLFPLFPSSSSLFFNLDKKIPLPRGGGMARICIPEVLKIQVAIDKYLTGSLNKVFYTDSRFNGSILSKMTTLAYSTTCLYLVCRSLKT